MKLGFFMMPVHPLGRNYAETLAEDREAVILCDRLGFAEAYCGEHLTDRIENIPNSLMFLASFVDSTRQIKLGTAVVNLPYFHPVVVASNAAMLDNLLEGRFILGVGAGILRTDAEAIELREDERQARFNEAIDHIVALWTGSAPYDITGRFWNISTRKNLAPRYGLGNIVATYQKPHPPIVGAIASPDSKGAITMGQRGIWPASSNLVHARHLKGHWENYARGCAEAGRTADRAEWRVGRSIFVNDDDRLAERYGKTDPKSPYRAYFDHLGGKVIAHAGHRNFKAEDAVPNEAVTLDYMVDQIVIAGSPNKVVDQILALREQTGDFGTLLYANPNWNDKTLARRSLELMAGKVMPAVNAAIARSQAAE
jgi:alkanesulfonate monooxygenase SsuD/methylene tetrahydromethanopterin reductase-like flavin-dependent oxidoreductase (luciferase family)